MELIKQLDENFEADPVTVEEAAFFIDDDDYVMEDLSDEQKLNKLCNFIVMQTNSTFRQITNASMHGAIKGKLEWLVDREDDSPLSASNVFSHSDMNSRDLFIEYMKSYLEKKLIKRKDEELSENGLRTKAFIEECIDKLKN